LWLFRTVADARLNSPSMTVSERTPQRQRLRQKIPRKATTSLPLVKSSLNMSPISLCTRLLESLKSFLYTSHLFPSKPSKQISLSFISSNFRVIFKYNRGFML
jgi:hypothetical protein